MLMDDAAEAHWGNFNGGNAQWLMCGYIAGDDIDWPPTIFGNSSHSFSEECEITLLKGRKVHLNWYQKRNDPSSRVVVDRLMEDDV